MTSADVRSKVESLISLLIPTSLIASGYKTYPDRHNRLLALSARSSNDVNELITFKLTTQELLHSSKPVNLRTIILAPQPPSTMHTRSSSLPRSPADESVIPKICKRVFSYAAPKLGNSIPVFLLNLRYYQTINYESSFPIISISFPRVFRSKLKSSLYLKSCPT